jgi:hypothetical protein
VSRRFCIISVVGVLRLAANEDFHDGRLAGHEDTFSKKTYYLIKKTLHFR